MADKMTPAQRHYCMSRIGSKNTKPELIVRRFLHAHGLRYRLHVRRLPGTPDLVLPRYKTVILVNGCFWHGHDCSAYKLPRTRTEFWEDKIARNRERDARKYLQLRAMNWHVIQIWECQLKPRMRQATLHGLLRTLNRILLLNYGAKEYAPCREEAIPMAAEGGSEYGLENDSSV